MNLLNDPTYRLFKRLGEDAAARGMLEAAVAYNWAAIWRGDELLTPVREQIAGGLGARKIA